MSSSYPALTVLTFWPLLAALLLALCPKDVHVRAVSLVASLIECALAIPLLRFQGGESGFQFLEKIDWVPAWGLSYTMGVDGISIFMVWLSVFTLPVCVLCSWTYIGQRVKEFHVCLLLMTMACVGVFSALDLVLFYFFWEALLIPMYLLIAVWGGDEKRYASIKFFIYTLAGSTLLLVAIVALRIQGGTFSIPELMKTDFGFTFQYWVFLAFFIAFAIKVPMFPFHTWLPAAHVQAPSAGSVILAAVLLKMGTYGFLRFSLPMTPAASAHFAPLMIAISIASILYGGLVALGQSDIKKLIAYSSVAHMGFVTLGIFVFSVQGAQGALFQMLNHGIITGALFCMIGAVYERSHSREIAKNQGLGKFLPCFMFFFGLFGFASFGFPGTNGFVGEFLVLAAAFKFKTVVGILCVPGALLAAAYILKLTLRMAWAEPSSADGKGWKDLKKKEWVYLALPAALVIYLGLSPSGFLSYVTPTLESAIADFDSRKGGAGKAAAPGVAAAPAAPAAPPLSAAGGMETGLSGALRERSPLPRGETPAFDSFPSESAAAFADRLTRPITE
ncbi:MAG: NADH-quinone oxidoreductase subunit M [Deltaproteobacteria bacterium]|jgi:NADH-quinone oxidoreductase subunit M|nr:NADH-quinone oxidoreductase subunit M [Deltaproteobacteria bacterium]